jgi:hypothetical protein
MDITKSEVRRDFSHMRMLMQMADKMLRQKDIDYSLGSEFEQLSLELIGSAHTLNAYIEERRIQQRAKS